MPDKFKNKYRIPSHRMPYWDYSGNGMYFITLVTQGRECNLGKIINDEMVLYDFGEIVKTEWNKSFEIRAELFCDEYIIMPNHLHAIVVIDKQNGLGDDIVETHDEFVETHGRASLRADHVDFTDQTDQAKDVFHRLPKSISSFIAGLKSAINTEIDDYIDKNGLKTPKYNKNNHFFQPNYHDHVIRNEDEYSRIKEYIKNNPAMWKDDKFYS